MDVLLSAFLNQYVFFAAAKEGAGAVDEEDFIKAFDDVPVVQVSEDVGLISRDGTGVHFQSSLGPCWSCLPGWVPVRAGALESAGCLCNRKQDTT